MSDTPIRWAVLWRSKNRLDGSTEHFVWDIIAPVLFRSRRDARNYINSKWGYIRRRPDLRAEPHGWMLPSAVKVSVRLEALL